MQVTVIALFQHGSRGAHSPTWQHYASKEDAEADFQRMAKASPTLQMPLLLKLDNENQKVLEVYHAMFCWD